MPEPKPFILQTPYAPHGGPDGSKDGPTGPLLDFSVNSNPFGPPRGLLAALQQLDLSSYPDPTYGAARAACAAHHGVSSERIVMGSAAELIYRLAACFLRPGERTLVASPSFGEYARASRLQGAQVQRCDVYLQGQPDRESLERALLERPALVWLCQPNNPTGHAWSSRDLERVADACAAQGALLVVDAAYLELSDAPAALPESAVQLFALTKTFAVAGLRAGYAVAPPEVAEVLRRAAPPWPVSTPAQAAVSWCRSPAGAAFVRRTVPELLRLRREFQAGLRELGLNVRETRSSFFLVEVGDASEVTARAKGAGFRLRDASSLGLPRCVRIAAQSRAVNARLLRWFRAC